jgi:hypothetical protein
VRKATNRYRAELAVETTEQLAVGNGGWLRYQSHHLRPPVFVRVELVGDRFRICELYMGGPGFKLSGQTVRNIPFNRIEAWANELRDNVGARLNAESPDLRRAISHFRSGPPRTVGLPGRPAPQLTWVDRMLLAQSDDGREPQAPGLPLVDHLPARTIRIDASLPVPANGRYGDAFYQAVAEMYLQLVRYVRSPAGVIADANNVPVSTAHRWIKVARARQYLPPGTRGKAG